MFNPGCMHIYNFFHQLTRKFNNFNNSNTFSINFEVTITLQSNWPTPDAVRLSGASSHRLSPSDYNIFFQNGPLPRIAIMNEEIRKLVYDSMQERTKKDKNHEVNV